MSERTGDPAEATRLLCVGTYLAPGFRRRVLEELVEHEERPVAPSLGHDVVPVLVHALRARRWDVATGAAALLVWLGFAAVSLGGGEVLYGSFTLFGACALALWLEKAAVGQAAAVYERGRASWPTAAPLLSYGIVGAVLTVLARGYPAVYWGWVLHTAVAGERRIWHMIVFPLLLALVVWGHRVRVGLLMRRGLSRDGFARAAPVRPPRTRRVRRIVAAIRREQHAPLAVYSPARPLVGYGLVYDAWAIKVELRRLERTSTAGTVPHPDAARPGPERPPVDGGLTNRDVLDLIRAELAGLRLPSTRTSQDRLRELRVDEFLSLQTPEERSERLYEPERVRTALRAALDADGESERHFLRVQVTAWDGQIVVCLLVRVHTQGGVLVLEVAPHVLPPVRDDFEEAAACAAGSRRRLLVREAAPALASAPADSLAAVVALGRAAVEVGRLWFTRAGSSRPEGPRTSVRELGCAQQVTLLHEMDVNRYVKTVHEQIFTGVQNALRKKGYETGEFQQKVVHVERGGVYIGGMSGGVASTGERSTVVNRQGERDDQSRLPRVRQPKERHGILG